MVDKRHEDMEWLDNLKDVAVESGEKFAVAANQKEYKWGEVCSCSQPEGIQAMKRSICIRRRKSWQNRWEKKVARHKFDG